MSRPAEWVEERKNDPAQQEHRRDRSGQDADGKDGRWFLRGGIGYVTAPVQHEQRQRDGDGGGHFLEQGNQAVKDALVALTGRQFIHFHRVRDDRPGQHVDG